jgi:hypothetical protein
MNCYNLLSCFVSSYKILIQPRNSRFGDEILGWKEYFPCVATSRYFISASLRHRKDLAMVIDNRPVSIINSCNRSIN